MFRRAAHRTSVACALSLGLVALSAAPASAQRRIAPDLGARLGGRAAPGYKAGRARIRRPYDRKVSAPGEGPAVTLGPRNAGYLDRAHYESVRDASLTLMKQYPPDKHFYIALGRSPSSMAGFLRELDPNMAMTFPASDLRMGVQPQWKAAYFDHFRELIPQDVLEGKRTMVLFDRSHAKSGSSLAVVKQLLDAFLAESGLAGKVHAVGFADSGPLQQGVEHIASTQWPRLFLYNNGQDDDEVVAPFVNKHRIGAADMSTIQPNSLHDSLLGALRSRMKSDAHLDAELKRHFPKLLQGAKARATPRSARAHDGRSRAKAWGLKVPGKTKGQGSLAEPLVLGKGDKKHAVLEPAQYADLREATFRLLTAAEPDAKTYFVGVGRSSSPNLAMLAELGAHASYLPADKVKGYDAATLQKVKPSFFDYFDRFIPKGALAKGSSIVLFHRSDSGQSLPIVEQLLTEYLQTKGSQASVRSHAFSREGGGPNRVDIGDLPQMEHLASTVVKALALQPLHQVGVDPRLERLAPSASYKSFRTRVRDLMAADPELHEFLNAAPPD